MKNQPVSYLLPKAKRDLNVSEKEDGKERPKEGEEISKEKPGGGEKRSCRNPGGKMREGEGGGA